MTDWPNTLDVALDLIAPPLHRDGSTLYVESERGCAVYSIGNPLPWDVAGVVTCRLLEWN